MNQLTILDTASEEQKTPAFIKHGVNGSADYSEEIRYGEHRYQLKTTNWNSNKYGNCEVCGKFCATVYHQGHDRYFEFNDKEGKLYSGWGMQPGLYGCEKCLIERRKQHFA